MSRLCSRGLVYPKPGFTEQERAREGTHTAPEAHSSSAGLGLGPSHHSLAVTGVGGGEDHRCL